MKRFILLLGVLLLFSCSTENVLENQEGIKDVEVKKDQTEITTDDGSKVTVATDENESVDIPEGYPKEILPVFDKATVVAASQNADGSYVIMAVVDGDMEDIISFYKDQLEGSTTVMEQNSADTYMKMGNMDGHDFTVTVSSSMDDNLGYDISFTLIVMEGSALVEPEESESEEDIATEKAPADFVIPEGVTWPESYPEKALPIYDTAYTEVKLTSAQGEQQMIGLMTEDKLEEVVKFYEMHLKDAADYTTMDMTGTTMLSATIDGLFITVMLTENDGSFGEDERFKTLIQIIY